MMMRMYLKFCCSTDSYGVTLKEGVAHSIIALWCEDHSLADMHDHGEKGKKRKRTKTKPNRYSNNEDDAV